MCTCNFKLEQLQNSELNSSQNDVNVFEVPHIILSRVIFATSTKCLLGCIDEINICAESTAPYQKLGKFHPYLQIIFRILELDRSRICFYGEFKSLMDLL